MPLQVAAEPAQTLQVIPRKVAGLGQAGVKGRRRVPLGEDETVAILPGGIARVMAHLVKIENRQHVDGRQAAAGMPRAGGIEHLEYFHAQVPGGVGQFADGLVSQHGGNLSFLAGPGNGRWQRTVTAVGPDRVGSSGSLLVVPHQVGEDHLVKAQIRAFRFRFVWAGRDRENGAQRSGSAGRRLRAGSRRRQRRRQGERQPDASRR